MCSQSGEPGLGAQARLGTVTHPRQLQARSQWPSAARSRHGSTELCQQVMITAFEPTYSPVLISPATQGIEVESQNQMILVTESLFWPKLCPGPAWQQKAGSSLHRLPPHFYPEWGNTQEAESSIYYRCSHCHIHEQISCKAAYLWRSAVSQLKMHFLKHSCLLSIP